MPLYLHTHLYGLSQACRDSHLYKYHAVADPDIFQRDVWPRFLLLLLKRGWGGGYAPAPSFHIRSKAACQIAIDFRITLPWIGIWKLTMWTESYKNLSTLQGLALCDLDLLLFVSQSIGVFLRPIFKKICEVPTCKLWQKYHRSPRKMS